MDSAPEREDRLELAEWLGDIAAKPVPDEAGVGSSFFLLGACTTDGGTCGAKLIWPLLLLLRGSGVAAGG